MKNLKYHIVIVALIVFACIKQEKTVEPKGVVTSPNTPLNDTSKNSSNTTVTTGIIRKIWLRNDTIFGNETDNSALANVRLYYYTKIK